jgi:7-cyano-7-deazaguanine synthase
MTRAVVLLSGGLDSAVAAFWAREQFDELFCLSLEYGQRHWVELEAAKKIVAMLPAHHKVGNVGPNGIGPRSVLTNKAGGAILTDQASVVPGRNMLFMWAACVHAQQHGASTVVMGCNGDDQAAYADCRLPTLEAMAHAMSLALEHEIKVVAPFVNISKADVLREAVRLDCMPAVRASWSCYTPVQFGRVNESKPCGGCPACAKRSAAFAEVSPP